MECFPLLFFFSSYYTLIFPFFFFYPCHVSFLVFLGMNAYERNPYRLLLILIFIRVSKKRVLLTCIKKKGECESECARTVWFSKCSNGTI